MSRPFLVWCWHRTGSSVLYKLLATLSEHPDANGEPFDGCDDATCPRQFSHVPRSPQRDQLLADICEHRWTIRHIFYPLPLDFNLALARTATRAGYRHIYLYRDPVARSVSLAIAEQRDTWIADGTTRAKLDECVALDAIDVARMVHLNTRARKMWRAIRPELSQLCPISYEQIFIGLLDQRRRQLRRLTNFLDIPAAPWRRHYTAIDRLLLRGGQDSQRLRYLIPNLRELRTRLAS